MGCDIHLFLERKVGNKWVMVKELDSPADNRNYARFSALAGVRGDGPAPKGLPLDISDSVKLHVDDWEGDGHSHSWETIDKAAKIFLDTESNPDEYAMRNPASYFFDLSTKSCRCCGQEILSIDNHRIVFFFDN